MTAFSKISQKELADKIGSLHTQIKFLTEQQGEYKTELKRRGLGLIVGLEFVVKVNDATRSTLDQKAVVDKLGQKWVDDHKTETHYVRIDVEPTAESLAAK